MGKTISNVLVIIAETMVNGNVVRMAAKLRLKNIIIESDS